MVALPKEGSNEKFDHVLIDLNQILHVVMRKSRNHEHGLALLMLELDACIEMATPTQTLVIAMDGPPCAAKLATQRRRRSSIIRRNIAKIEQLEQLVQTGKRKLRKSALVNRKRKAAGELRALSLTPGTAMMEKAAHATLYWAWQRMSNPRSPLRRVQIFFSPSTVPGEGEVKLLEWLYTKRRKGSSIAILGGDSDLVLEALIVPPTVTHDIFVLLPDGPNKYLCVSLWETTRSLQQNYIQHMTMANVMKVRTDLVVLFILNGNDYLPKLRGSSGFSKLFQAYKKIQSDWYVAGRADDAYMVDPDSLNFNLEFCIDFFSYVNRTSNVTAFVEEDPVKARNALSKLHSLADCGILPKPIQFSTVRYDEDEEEGSEVLNADEDDNIEAAPPYQDDELNEDDESEEDFDEDDESGDQCLLRLTLGNPESEDSYTYELWWDRDKRERPGRHKLAEMALADLFGEEYVFDDTDDDEDSVDDQARILVAAEGKVDLYLHGILWNLQTYQVSRFPKVLNMYPLLLH